MLEWRISPVHVRSPRYLLLCLLASVGAMAKPGMAHESEPRAYSSAPVGTHFLMASYTQLGGDVLTDPSLPITNVTAKIDILALGYVQVFDFLGRTASVGVVLPYSRANVAGKCI